MENCLSYVIFDVLAIFQIQDLSLAKIKYSEETETFRFILWVCTKRNRTIPCRNDRDIVEMVKNGLARPVSLYLKGIVPCALYL